MIIKSQWRISVNNYLWDTFLLFSPVVVGFLSAPGSRHVSHLIRTAETYDKTCQQSLSWVSFSRPQGYSSFRRHHLPENCHTPSAFLSTTQLLPRSLLLRARHWQQLTSLIFTFNSASRTLLIHEVSYAARSSHVLNITIAPALAQAVTDDNKNHSQ